MTAEERAFNVVNKNNIKTLQARAWSVLDYFRFQHIVTSEELLTAKIVEVLKDQIEECAKVCDDADKSTHPADIADKIRALAAPIETGKED